MELFSRTYGQGPPIVILHGLFGFSDNWQTVAKALSDTHTVITIDQRNHGRSPHAASHNYHDLSEDLYAYLNQHWIFETIVMGHSMGGKAAMQFALDYPEMVSKLIVVDIAPGQSKSRQDDVIDALLSIDLTQINERAAIETLLLAKLKENGTVQFLLKNITRNEDGNFKWKMNLEVLARDQDAILAPVVGAGNFDKPTLFIKGSESKYIGGVDEVTGYFPKGELITIPKAGHWVHADQPLLLIEAVRNFIG
jgi:esterase